MDKLLENAERLIRAVTPLELSDRPIYLLAHDEVADAWFSGDNARTFAQTAFWLDLHLEEQLRRRGAWRGRGLAVLFNLPLFTAEHGGRDAQLGVLGAGLHEAAHYLSGSYLRTCEGNWLASQHRGGYFELKQWATLKDTHHVPRWVLEDARDDDHQHGPNFIRAACHLQRRAERLGCPIDDRFLRFAGEAYGMSREATYRAALSQELDQTFGTSLWQLLETRWPRGFAMLVQSDREELHYQLTHGGKR